MKTVGAFVLAKLVELAATKVGWVARQRSFAEVLAEDGRAATFYLASETKDLEDGTGDLVVVSGSIVCAVEVDPALVPSGVNPFEFLSQSAAEIEQTIPTNVPDLQPAFGFEGIRALRVSEVRNVGPMRSSHLRTLIRIEAEYVHDNGDPFRIGGETLE